MCQSKQLASYGGRRRTRTATHEQGQLRQVSAVGRQGHPDIQKQVLISIFRLQTLKDIFLFCKNCLGLASTPETKLLVMHLVRDLIEREPSEDTMKLVEQILLKKIT